MHSGLDVACLASLGAISPSEQTVGAQNKLDCTLKGHKTGHRVQTILPRLEESVCVAASDSKSTSGDSTVLCGGFKRGARILALPPLAAAAAAACQPKGAWPLQGAAPMAPARPSALKLAQLPEPLLEAIFAKCDVRTR